MMFLIAIFQAVPRYPEFRFQEPVNWNISEGENWAIIGPNGAGKTTLTDILQRKIVLKNGKVSILTDENQESYHWIKSMAFRDIYSMVDCKSVYYQQRWNAADAEETPLAVSFLKDFPEEKVRKYTQLLGIDNLLEKRIIALSSGELRKFLIARALITEPKVLILDNPFIGLDAGSRNSLNAMLVEMGKWKGLQTILVLSNPEDMPEWIEYVLPVYEKKCLGVMGREDFLKDDVLMQRLFPERDIQAIALPAGITQTGEYDIAVLMEKVRVQYGEKVILSQVDWKIRKGEKWVLLGKNGSGKSTLLSLICGDNPQAYANKLTLFGRKRGSGESIWDIKKRIGYLSPDMHTYYLQDVPCVDVVGSGFFDSIGLYRKCNEGQKKLAQEWLQVLGISHLALKSFVKISYGEQRLVLLARAFVKDPELLILDEPLHGLDAGKKQLARSVIEAFCARKDKTMIYVTHYTQEIPACVTFRKILEA